MLIFLIINYIFLNVSNYLEFSHMIRKSKVHLNIKIAIVTNFNIFQANYRTLKFLNLLFFIVFVLESNKTFNFQFKDYTY